MQNNVATAEIPVARRQFRGGSLICLMGIDDTVRTTQAAALAETLRAQGVDAVQAQAKWKPRSLFPVRLQEPASAWFEVSRSSDRRAAPASTALVPRRRASVCKCMVLLDQARRALFKIRLPLLAGRTIVADQYIYDTLVDLSMILGCRPNELLQGRLLRLFPRPNLTILLDADPEACAARHGNESREGYLARRKDLYSLLGSALGTERVDAELRPPEVQAEIRRKVWKRLGV